jgi:hypothetical protein
MAEVHRYHEQTIRFGVQQSPTTLYWRARGTIEYTEGGMFWTFMMTEQSTLSQQKPKLNPASFSKHKNGSMIGSVLKACSA